MTITLNPEHERINEAQLASGRFHSVDDVVDQALAPLKDVARASADVSEEEHQRKAQAAAARIRELSQGVTLDRPPGMSLREYAHLGHKY